MNVPFPRNFTFPVSGYKISYAGEYARAMQRVLLTDGAAPCALQVQGLWLKAWRSGPRVKQADRHWGQEYLPVLTLRGLVRVQQRA